MKIIMLNVLSLCLVVALGASPVWAGSAEAEKVECHGGKSLPIRELKSGFYNQYVNEKRYILAKSESELLEVERLIGTSLDVDLERHMALAAFMGTQPTGGYAIEVTDAVNAGSTLGVRVVHTSTGPSCIVTTALTSPYQVVLLPRVDHEELSVKESFEVNHCGGAANPQ